MPKKVFQKVYLYDNYPSDISARMTIRETVWNIVSTIEAGGSDRTLFLEYDTIIDAEECYDLPLSFGKPCSKSKSKKRKKSKVTLNDYDQKFTEFSETKSEHNMYMGYSEVDGLFYPCRVVGVGSKSRPGREYALVQYIGYGSFAELERATCLKDIPVERINEIKEYVIYENLLSAVGGVADLKKYYDQRYRLFSKFDQGVLLDAESWFSITPECVSTNIADKCKEHAEKKGGVSLGIILDCFCGVGGNVLALAERTNCKVVIAVDIDKTKLDMLCTNAKIYGVLDKIDCIHDDAYNIISNLHRSRLKKDATMSSQRIDVKSREVSIGVKEYVKPDINMSGFLPVDIIVLAPPWGGIDYTNKETAFNLRTMIPSGDGVELFYKALLICPNIVYLLPKNTKKKDLVQLGRDSDSFYRIEDVYIHNKLKMIVAYYGPLFKL